MLRNTVRPYIPLFCTVDSAQSATKNYLLPLESAEGATATTATDENEEFDWQVDQKLPDEVHNAEWNCSVLNVYDGDLD